MRKTKASGLGIRVTASSEGIMVEGVVDLYRNSIHIGDIIAAVDGSILRGLSFAESISILKAIPVGGRCHSCFLFAARHTARTQLMSVFIFLIRD